MTRSEIQTIQECIKATEIHYKWILEEFFKIPRTHDTAYDILRGMEITLDKLRGLIAGANAA